MANVNINDYVADIGFGSGTDRTKFEEDGTLKAEGAATTWDDITGSLIGRRLSATTGKVDYNWEENTVTMQSNGNISNTADLLNFNLQFPHSAKIDSTMKLHMHWEQPDSTTREITVKHRIQSNGVAKNTTWITTVIDTNTNNVFTYSSGTLNQITRLVDIDMTGMSISSTIQFQIARTDNATADIDVTFIDAHVESDTLGSRGEFTK